MPKKQDPSKKPQKIDTNHKSTTWQKRNTIIRSIMRNTPSFNSSHSAILRDLNAYADYEGKAYPRMKTLSIDNGLKERQLRNILNDLISHGFIIKKKLYEPGKRQDRNVYFLTIDDYDNDACAAM